MKTAMMEAIERIEKMVSIRNFQIWEQLKKEFLEKEKKQIADSYNAGKNSKQQKQQNQ